MCRRMVRHSDTAHICARFSVRRRPESLPATWNLTGGDTTFVIRRKAEGRGREAVPMRWGLALDHPLLETAPPHRCIPARVLTRAARLEALFLTNRCIVPVDAFYMGPAAWAKGARPWAFALADSGLIGMAGLWIGPPGGETVALIATSPNESVALMDDSMPALLFPEDERAWLNAAHPYDAYTLIKPFPAELMRAWPVVEEGADGPDMLRRVA